ncbi:hypothetical protein ACWDGI_08945 [Streptomyces sp. NPDC001220]
MRTTFTGVSGLSSPPDVAVGGGSGLRPVHRRARDRRRPRPGSVRGPGPELRRRRAARRGARLGWEGIHPEDVPLCLETDILPFAMAAAREDGHLVLRPVADG